MAKRKHIVVFGQDGPSEGGSSKLRKQSRYSGAPWKPGEIPKQPFMSVSVPNDTPSTPYGDGYFDIELPKSRGRGIPPRRGDV